MLNIGSEERLPKCYFIHSKLPSYMVQSQSPPSKRHPFSIILRQTFNHTLNLTLPNTIFAKLKATLATDDLTLRYLKIYMKPSTLLEESFLTTYIKSDNDSAVLMLSEGRPGIDHVFSLHQGLLRLEVDKPTFERLGLEGRPIPGHGRKHVKARYLVEVDLRSASMVSGKKGFERVRWALKNVFDATMTWLAYGLESQEGPIWELQPLWREVNAREEWREDAQVPRFLEWVEEDDGVEAGELLEWVSLVELGSPQVSTDAKIDPYLCRYETPDFGNDEKGKQGVTQDLTVLTWQGLASASFALRIFLAALKISGDEWFAFSASTFGDTACTVLKHGDHTMSWEYGT